MPAISFTAKEIHALVQMIVYLIEEGVAFEYATKAQLESMRAKLQNVKDG